MIVVTIENQAQLISIVNKERLKILLFSLVENHYKLCHYKRQWKIKEYFLPLAGFLLPRMIKLCS